MPTTPHFVVVCALIERGGRVLVAQRPAGKAQARRWEFPGGKIEPDETPAAALVREIREELVIDGNCTQRVLGVINDDTNDVGAVHLGIVHLFELDTDRVRANEAALANLRFVSPEELSGEMFEKLETWSQLALELFKNRGA